MTQNFVAPARQLDTNGRGITISQNANATGTGSWTLGGSLNFKNYRNGNAGFDYRHAGVLRKELDG